VIFIRGGQRESNDPVPPLRQIPQASPAKAQAPEVQAMRARERAIDPGEVRDVHGVGGIAMNRRSFFAFLGAAPVAAKAKTVPPISTAGPRVCVSGYCPDDGMGLGGSLCASRILVAPDDPRREILASLAFMTKQERIAAIRRSFPEYARYRHLAVHMDGGPGQ
jgi:hypothetical protein